MLSPTAARLAEKKGYKNVKVFHAGLPAWARAGMPVLSTQKFVRNRMGYIVLIDTRGPKAAKAGQIQGAVAMTLSQIPKEKSQFPLSRKAYIVLYSKKTELKKLAPAVKTIAGWGYHRTTIMIGGYEGWRKRKGPIERDLVRSRIFYLPRPLPGEITGDEFMNVVRGQPKDKQILDVRTAAEVAGGMIQGAVNIPVDELPGRLKELPKGKEIIVHCRTGLRSQMAYDILRNAGFRVRFLNDKVAILQQKLFCCYK